ncbi:YjbE family integral membrane protein [Paenibacillus phyllosphaerae]|uniref:YjbE family integral membrane protein n=1 Tax=Paenibacillus phyllosphaerae TaxID=274593 RepID=A0A7W5B1S4_9BACL|nr:TerC family protein [Paenibacillus phyllosphaerae]MBB3112778.1 YjbE family integral membrane protein [Paenibacillus phyllosphaerae]
MEFWTALITIVFIDLILAGDNAIVIGMAARSLPKEQQKQAIIGGTIGAVGIRILATVLVVYLLMIPWLLLIGGVMLLWIAYKLLVQEDSHGELKAGNTIWASIRTIIIADAAMGLDNVIAVAGAAHGNFLLVVLGLLISIPIVVWGSTLFIKLIEKLPWIMYVGSGVLAYTAAKMVTHEPKIEGWFDEREAVRWAFLIVMVIVVIAAGLLTNKVKKKKESAQHQAA